MKNFEKLNYYEILKIPANASLLEVKKGYREALSIYKKDALAGKRIGVIDYELRVQVTSILRNKCGITLTIGIEHVALDGPFAFRRCAVHAETGAEKVGIIWAVKACRADTPVVVDVLGPHAEIAVSTQLPAITGLSNCSQLCAQSACYQPALRVFGVLRANINNAVDCIGSPKCCTGAAHDLNLLDIRKDHVNFIPDHAAEQQVVCAATINADLQLVRKQAVETTYADRPLAGIQAANVQPRNHP